jgi:predicted ribosome quality control (RQC) complex YloA/Tae2 family protein
LQATQAEGLAKKKIDKVKEEQEGILRSLSNQQHKLEMAAMIIETYADEINKVSLVINSAINNGMSWEDIALMVEHETAAGW